jgi:hypothetical protein
MLAFKLNPFKEGFLVAMKSQQRFLGHVADEAGS